MHLAYFAQRDQHGIIAKHLFQREIFLQFPSQLLNSLLGSSNNDDDNGKENVTIENKHLFVGFMKAKV